MKVEVKKISLSEVFNENLLTISGELYIDGRKAGKIKIKKEEHFMLNVPSAVLTASGLNTTNSRLLVRQRKNTKQKAL